MTTWPDLCLDELEWEESPGQATWAIVVEADARKLPGLARAREIIGRLPVLQHPDHYLHVTLRQLESPGCVGPRTLDEIEAMIASTPRWQARVCGLGAFPTAIWADPDRSGEFRELSDRLLGEVGDLAEHPRRSEMISHLTLAYSQGAVPSEEVRAVLEPANDLDIGLIEVDEAILAELSLTSPYPHWRVVRRFPLKQP